MSTRRAPTPNCWPPTSPAPTAADSRSPSPAPISVDRYRTLVAQRAQRIPLQHLTGTAAFGPLTLEVGPGVFIPRPETESLLEWALAATVAQRPLIVDLCTGSGALALALATTGPTPASSPSTTPRTRCATPGATSQAPPSN